MFKMFEAAAKAVKSEPVIRAVGTAVGGVVTAGPLAYAIHKQDSANVKPVAPSKGAPSVAQDVDLTPILFQP